MNLDPVILRAVEWYGRAMEERLKAVPGEPETVKELNDLVAAVNRLAKELS